MRLLDFLFWNYYCFYKKHAKIFVGRLDEVGHSSLLISISCCYPLIPVFDEWSLFLICIFLEPLSFFILDKHYRKSDIAKDNYSKIRIKWENTSHKKIKKALILIFTIYGTVGWFFLLVIISRFAGKI